MNNSVGKIIKTIGKIIIGLSVLAGIIVWITVAHKMNGAVGFCSAMGTFVSFFISGIMFIGFSEIIFLLQENLDVNRKNTNDYNQEEIQQDIPLEEATTEIDIKKVIEEKATKKENEIQCPHCGHIQSDTIKRCLSCSKMIIE